MVGYPNNSWPKPMHRLPMYGPSPGQFDDGSGGGWPQRPANYLVFAILVTCFCCLPLGVVGIVYSVQVESRYNVRDFAGAANASAKAKNFSIAALIAGGVIGMIYVLIAIFALQADLPR
jgi:hypothetical protein